MTVYERKEQEIKTIKPRKIKLNLSDVDYGKLAIAAAKAELSISEFLEGFIGDLVDGTYSHGSDERMLAEEWYIRCGFDHEYGYKFSFLHYLISDYCLDEFMETIKYYEYTKCDLEMNDEEIKNPDLSYEDYINGIGEQGDIDIDSYIEILEKEKKELQKDLELLSEEVEDFWKSYLKWTDVVNPEREKEIKKVLKWYHKYGDFI